MHMRIQNHAVTDKVQCQRALNNQTVIGEAAHHIVNLKSGLKVLPNLIQQIQVWVSEPQSQYDLHVIEYSECSL